VPINLPEAHLATARRILRFWAPDVPAFVFGSRAHGRQLRETSDLDICLRGDEPLPTTLLRQVKDAFELSDLPMRVDIVDWNELGAEFRKAIEADLTPLV